MSDAYKKESVKWLYKAGNAGSVDAMYRLGEKYCRGEEGIIEQNWVKAIYWLDLALEQGSKDAKKLLDFINNYDREEKLLDTEVENHTEE
jgi:TPR repeat protein